MVSQAALISKSYQSLVSWSYLNFLETVWVPLIVNSVEREFLKFCVKNETFDDATNNNILSD